MLHQIIENGKTNTEDKSTGLDEQCHSPYLYHSSSNYQHIHLGICIAWIGDTKISLFNLILRISSSFFVMIVIEGTHARCTGLDDHYRPPYLYCSSSNNQHILLGIHIAWI